MRFFTRHWYHTKWATGAVQATFDAYTAHLQSMDGVLTPEVLQLAVLPGVDDSLVVQARWKNERRDLKLTLRCGDLQMGYFDLVLHYCGASMTEEDERTLTRVARSADGRREADLAYHELDTTEDGGVRHGFLFHPGYAFDIQCRGLSWQKNDRTDRSLPRCQDRFPNGLAMPCALLPRSFRYYRRGIDLRFPRIDREEVTGFCRRVWDRERRRIRRTYGPYYLRTS